METMTVRVFDIGEIDELSNQSNIVSVYNIYYDAIIDNVIEVIVLYNVENNQTKILLYHEDIQLGAIEMGNTFWNDLNEAKSTGEVVLLDGDEELTSSLINLMGKFIHTEKREQ